MFVDVHCRKCGQHKRLDVGDPGATPVVEYIRLLTDRLTHRPSFECFGGHFELKPPLPEFWEIDWGTLSGRKNEV